MSATIFEEILRALDGDVPFALGILSGAKGSSPQKRGAKALFFADGRIAGTLGGGCLEAEVRRRALHALHTNTPASIDLLLDHDFGWDDGLICGGKVTCLILPDVRGGREVWAQGAAREKIVHWSVGPDFSIALGEAIPNPLYRETIFLRENLWIAGAGHIARTVAPLALQLDFRVTVFDDRPSMASRQFFPEPIELRVDSWERMLEVDLPAAPTLGLIVTRGHNRDALTLARWIQRPFAFLGMIGSARKRRLIFSELAAEGFATEEELAARVACPVGLPIEAVAPQEIAVSIAAQLIQNRAARLAQHAPAVL